MHQQDKAIATLLAALIEHKNDEAREALEQIYSRKYRSLHGLAEMMLASVAKEEKKGAALAPSTSSRLDIDNAIVKARSLISGEAPDFSVTTLTGEEITTSKLQGKVVVLDFWATWCGPCQQELPHYQKAHEKYRDNANVVFLAISTDDNDQVVQDFIAKNQYTFATARSPKTAQAYGVTAIPTLIILGKDEKMEYRQVGFDSNSDFVKMLSQKIDLLLTAKVK